MENNNKYDFLSKVISLIYSGEFLATITTLSKECDVPISFMRKTIITLLDNSIIQSCLSAADYSDEESENDLLDQYLEDPEHVVNLITSGRFDDYVWRINLKVLNQYEEDEILFLTQSEYGAIVANGETLTSIRHAPLFEKKENVIPLPPQIRENLTLLHYAIADKSAVTFSYKKTSGEVKTVTTIPKYIKTDIIDNWIYMSSTEGRVFRLDRISRLSNAPDVAVANADENPKLKYIWGVSARKDSEPVHVKLQIVRLTKNLITKIQNDTAFRKETCRLYKDGDYYYYEDDIIGIEDFRRWMRSYGSSLIVLEPAEMRDDIVAKAHETLALYEASKNWHDL